jgi:hypothetical protein
MVDAALRSYFMTTGSAHTLTKPEEVQEAIKGVKVSKTPGPNGIPNRALKHPPQQAVPLLFLILTRTSLPITP